MAVIEEPRLRADLKAGKLARVYFLWGEEDFLIRMYSKRIIEAAVPAEAQDMNFVKYSDPPSSDELSDVVDNLPFFSERKCVLIEDLDPDALDAAENKAYLGIIENVPDTTVLIIAQAHLVIDPKKPKAKMKKLMEAAAKAGCSCEMKFMSAAQISAMAEKRAARNGCALSREDGAYLAELCGRSLTAVSSEVDKLCAYKNGSAITRADIDALCPKPADASIYALADELIAGHTERAFSVLDDLFVRREEPIMILAALSGYFTDLYRAKIGAAARKSYTDTAAAFRYPPNRSFVMRKAYGTVQRLSESFLEQCIEILFRTNVSLNSSSADARTLIEEALTEISVLTA
ncbi:MAG: DNA polymerase III subunit delta [Oscillospiraceae bacterium]